MNQSDPYGLKETSYWEYLKWVLAQLAKMYCKSILVLKKIKKGLEIANDAKNIFL